MIKHLILSFFFIILSCDIHKKATGFYDKIYVFGDKVMYQSARSVLNQTLAAPHELPVYEKRYVLEYHPFKDFKRYKYSKNILFLIALEKKTPFNAVLSTLLSKNAMKRAKEGTYNFFLAKNGYAEKQALLFFVPKDAENIEGEFLNQFYETPTFEQFETYTIERVGADLYKYEENYNIHDAIAKKQTFTLRSPQGFSLVDNLSTPDSNITSLFASNPTRWIWATSLGNVVEEELTTKKILDLRDLIASKYFEGDSVDRLNTIYQKDLFDKKFIIKRVQGSYKTYSEGVPIGGGPFITYAYIDKNKNSLWLVDGSVFNPGKRKSLNLMEVEAIINTFTTKE